MLAVSQQANVAATLSGIDAHPVSKRPVKRMLQVSLSFPVFRDVSDGKAAFGGTMGTVEF